MYKLGADELSGSPEWGLDPGGSEIHPRLQKEDFIIISNLFEKIKSKTEKLWEINELIGDFTKSNLSGLTPKYLIEPLTILNQLMIDFNSSNINLQDLIKGDLTTKYRTSKKIAVDYFQEEWDDPNPNPHNIPPEELSNLPEEPSASHWSGGDYPEFKLDEYDEIMNGWADYMGEILHWTQSITKDILKTKDINKLMENSPQLSNLIIKLADIIQLSQALERAFAGRD